MANTVRIIPLSGSITFSSNVTNISSSLSSTSMTMELDNTTGIFAIASGSQDVISLDIPNSKVSIDNNIQFKIPVKYIGVGEKMEDLQVFDKKEFVDSLFS